MGRQRWTTVTPRGVDNPPGLYGHSLGVHAETRTLVLFGGRKADQTPSNDTYIFEFDKMKWSLLPVSGDIPPARYGHFAAISGKKLLLFGGKDQVQFFNDVHVLNLTTRKWKRVQVSSTSSKIPPARAYPTCAITHVVERVVLIVTGGVAGTAQHPQYLNDTWYLDCSDWRWYPIPIVGCVPDGRMSASACVVHNKLLMYGGRGRNDSVLDDVSMLTIHAADDVIYGQYDRIPCEGQSVPRFGHSMCLVGDSAHAVVAVVIGGRTFDRKTRQVKHTDDVVVLKILHTPPPTTTTHRHSRGKKAKGSKGNKSGHHREAVQVGGEDSDTSIGKGSYTGIWIRPEVDQHTTLVRTPKKGEGSSGTPSTPIRPYHRAVPLSSYENLPIDSNIFLHSAVAYQERIFMYGGLTRAPTVVGDEDSSDSYDAQGNIKPSTTQQQQQQQQQQPGKGKKGWDTPGVDTATSKEVLVSALSVFHDVSMDPLIPRPSPARRAGYGGDDQSASSGGGAGDKTQTQTQTQTPPPMSPRRRKGSRQGTAAAGGVGSGGNSTGDGDDGDDRTTGGDVEGTPTANGKRKVQFGDAHVREYKRRNINPGPFNPPKMGLSWQYVRTYTQDLEDRERFKAEAGVDKSSYKWRVVSPNPIVRHRLLAEGGALDDEEDEEDGDAIAAGRRRRRRRQSTSPLRGAGGGNSDSAGSSLLHRASAFLRGMFGSPQ